MRSLVKTIAAAAITDKTMQTRTNEHIASVIEYETANHTAISEAFRIIAAENELTANAEMLLCFTVYILIEEGYSVDVERVRCLASKRAVGLSADQAIDAILEDSDLQFNAGRVEIVGRKAAR